MRQLFDPKSSTYTYLLGDVTTGEAILIDPCLDQVRGDSETFEAHMRIATSRAALCRFYPSAMIPTL